ncbi:nicotinamide-nucleotide amidase [Mucilaginibacter sp. UYP25]|uniref:CinA family protein n=1 Tax=unclassified Mucilaginibacter TaxID=2617802 RepID=UPI0033929FB9
MVPKLLVKKFNALLEKEKLTIFCGESITAGLLASTLASVRGASAVLAGSIVTYDERVKTAVLKVGKDILQRYTAESQETTTAMCYGLQKCFPGAGIYVAVTGTASASVNDYREGAPVGRVFITILYNGVHQIQANLTAGNAKDERNAIREEAVKRVLHEITELLLLKKVE